MLAILASIPVLHAQTAGVVRLPQAVYEGRIDAQVILASSAYPAAVSPLKAGIQVYITEQRRVGIIILGAATPLAPSIMEGVIRGVVLEALNESLEAVEEAAPAPGEFLYVRGAKPVVCKEIYRASTPEANVTYIPTTAGLLPAEIHANAEAEVIRPLISGMRTSYEVRGKVELTLRYLGLEEACGSSVLTKSKTAAIKAAILIILLGVAASIAWRTRVKPVAIAYSYYGHPPLS
ncbi:hypothetical protein [Stetteria hydrogenophila]